MQLALRARLADERHWPCAIWRHMHGRWRAGGCVMTWSYIHGRTDGTGDPGSSSRCRQGQAVPRTEAEPSCVQTRSWRRLALLGRLPCVRASGMAPRPAKQASSPSALPRSVGWRSPHNGPQSGCFSMRALVHFDHFRFGCLRTAHYPPCMQAGQNLRVFWITALTG